MYQKIKYREKISLFNLILKFSKNLLSNSFSLRADDEFDSDNLQQL